MRMLLSLVFIFLSMDASYAHEKEISVYDKVLKSGKIKCGYTLYSVGLNRDLKTGELWGIYKDLVEEIGNKLDLEIEWTEEVGWGQQIEGLNTGRYDMVCSPANITAPRAKSADMISPFYFSPVWIWVRSDDTRFDNKGRDIMNDPSFKVSVMDGEQSEAQADFYLPNASKFSIPQSSSFSSLLLNVTTGKGDIAFAEPTSVYEFMENNPDGLKKVAGDKPLYLAGNIMLIKRGEHDFRRMIDNVMKDLLLSGSIDKIIDKFEKYPNSYIRAKGY